MSDFSGSEEYADIIRFVWDAPTIYEHGFRAWVGKRERTREEFREVALDFLRQAELDLAELRRMVEVLPA